MNFTTTSQLKKIAFHYFLFTLPFVPKKQAPKKKQLEPLSVRLTPEAIAKLEQYAADLGLKKHALAQMAIDAAIKAIEEGGGKLVLPIQFQAKYLPAPRPPDPPTERTDKNYPPHRDQITRIEETAA